MKTIKQILLTIAVLLCSLTANAYDFEVDGIYYNIISATDFTAEVTFGENKYSGEVVIPSTVNYNGEVYSVISIGEKAFYNCDNLTSIEIPSSVTSIEKSYYNGHSYGAFEGCSNLTTVTFEENSQLTSIGGAAFRGCSSLTSIEIPGSVVSIETASDCGYCIGAFEGCSNLTTVTFGENSHLTSIGVETFYQCSSLTSIEIPNSVTSIGGGAFYNCDNLTSIEIPSSVISIGFFSNLPPYIGAFEECSNLKTVTFGENSLLTSIGKYAFLGCSSLTNIEIPNSVTSIGEKAFSGCTSLKDFRIEDGYIPLELGCPLFGACPLETIYLGRNLSYDNSENPDNLLFNDMITLKTLTIGSFVTEIPEKTFYDCINLESIYMRGVPPIISDDTFSNTSYYVATLYVPEGTLAFYQTANVWKNFWNIQEYEPTSIENIEANEVNFTITSNGISFSNADNTTICIYTINGILVKKIDKYTGEEITLENGVYIVCVGDKAMKIKL